MINLSARGCNNAWIPMYFEKDNSVPHQISNKRATYSANDLAIRFENPNIETLINEAVYSIRATEIPDNENFISATYRVVKDIIYFLGQYFLEFFNCNKYQKVKVELEAILKNYISENPDFQISFIDYKRERLKGQPFKGLSIPQQHLIAELLTISFISHCASPFSTSTAPSVLDGWSNADKRSALFYISNYRQLDDSIAKAAEFIMPDIATVKRKQDLALKELLKADLPTVLIALISDNVLSREMEVAVEYEKIKYWKNKAWDTSFPYAQCLNMKNGLPPLSRNPATDSVQAKELILIPPTKAGELYTFKEIWPDIEQIPTEE